jgi:predicted alpha/beta hydrolase
VTETGLDGVSTEDAAIPAVDGFPLAGTLFTPRSVPEHAVLINSGAAIPRRIYRGFAGHLAQQGCVVLTYDYRGIGGSRPHSLKGFKASMADWAALDITGAVNWMRQRYGTMPLRYVGHSFGGQTLGLLANNTDVSRALLVAAQAGYWKLMAPGERWRVVTMLNGVGVPLTHAFGYTPGWAGVGEDLPKGVFLQWVRWIMSPRYLFDDASLPGLANFPRYSGPLRALCLADDPWATRPAVELLCAGYSGTAPELLSIAPQDIGASAIGHVGFFRAAHRDTLWRSATEWLLKA